MKFNQVELSEKTCEGLRELGLENQSIENIINGLIAHAKCCGRYWSDKN